MKSIKLFTLAVAVCATLALPALAQENHGHSHVATPKGGRALDKTSPLAELVIEKDRTVTINFYIADTKPVAVTTQTVTLIADAKSGKQTLEFEKKGDPLASKTKLPEGDGYNLVVQFKTNRRSQATELPLQARPPHLWRMQARGIRLRLPSLISALGNPAGQAFLKGPALRHEPTWTAA
ncbi:MAG TPA: hypothetical protein VFZ59_08530 [Verrucomicrobiae bacterium]|nr:hypothetical protein [Verrucomicrobiae bacterium]